MGDVAEGTAVHECGATLEGLHEVGEYRVLEKERHGAGGLELAGGDGLPVAGEADDDATDAGLEILQVGGEAEDRHDLAAGHDDEALLAHGCRR